MVESRIFVFDIDGTLADVTHRRHWVSSKPKNWAAWDAGIPRDTVHEDIAWMLRNFHEQGHKIILCSGRDSKHRDITVKWMANNSIPYHALYMRAEKDNRKDSIVKLELLFRIREEHGEPFLWVDDRDQVVEAVRAEGVRVLQVAPGDF
jgi:uncharacterized HAD superfamily protein